MKRVLDVFRLVNDRLVQIQNAYFGLRGIIFLVMVGLVQLVYQIFHLSLHLKVIQVLVIVLFKLVYQ